MLRYLTARSVLTLQVALLFLGQQADSSLLCGTSVLCLPVLVCAGSCLCCIAVHRRGGGSRNVSLHLLLACSSGGGEAGYGFILLPGMGSESSREVFRQRFASCQQCCQTPWWKGSISGNVKHRVLATGLQEGKLAVTT